MNRRNGMLWTACLLTSLCACEQRVVGVKNRWVGGAPTIERQPSGLDPKPKGFFASVGDAFFGWTRAFGHDQEPSTITPPPATFGSRPPSAEPPTTRTSAQVRP